MSYLLSQLLKSRCELICREAIQRRNWTIYDIPSLTVTNFTQLGMTQDYANSVHHSLMQIYVDDDDFTKLLEKNETIIRVKDIPDYKRKYKICDNQQIINDCAPHGLLSSDEMPEFEYCANECSRQWRCRSFSWSNETRLCRLFRFRSCEMKPAVNVSVVIAL